MKALHDLMTLNERDGFLSGPNEDYYEELMVKLYPDVPLEPADNMTAEQVKEAAIARVEAQKKSVMIGKSI